MRFAVPVILGVLALTALHATAATDGDKVNQEQE